MGPSAEYRQMTSLPVLRHKLPNRRSGSFGSSVLGQTMEWTTATWLRFKFAILCMIFIVVALSVGGRALERLEFLLLSPFIAIIMLLFLKIFGVIVYFIPGPNRVFGWLRLLFFWTFSRLIVQQAPELDMPLWIDLHR
jgi:hypothetical protein